ncbi:O-antigen ligase family protein [Falsiroseomonas sp.]|uniref:O-antigen ligase family protein n=1 Tax=Falsiroseomonas sp. TaxID=2870721 RepID=UPI003F6EF70C
MPAPLPLMDRRVTPASAFSRSPTLPLLVMLIVVPVVAVLQFRAIALVTSLGLLAMVVAGRRVTGAWPWPRIGPVLGAALAIGAWTMVSAAWAPDPLRALGTGLRFGGFVLLAAAAARAMGGEPPRHLALAGRVLAAGLAIGIALAAADHLSGNAIRAAVRGLREVPVWLFFGLKSAVAVIAVLLPVAAAWPGLRWWARVALVVAGLAASVMLPAESAKIAAFAGILALGAAWLLGPWAGRLLGLAAAVVVLVAPLLTAAILPRLPGLEAIQPSAAHRILIWDFANQRIAERPLLGWGGESARAIPGGSAVFDRATLDRFGLTSEASRTWFARPPAQRLPLHTHNAALQVWLELGAVGAVLAAAMLAALGFAAARLGPGAVGAYGAALVVGMLSYGIWQEWWIGMLLLLAVAIRAIQGPRSSKI